MNILPTSLHLEPYLALLIAQHIYAAYIALFFIVVCETAFLPLFFLPGDPLIFITGAFCASSPLQAWVIIPLLIFATVLGSLINYQIGSMVGCRFGHKLFSGEFKWLDQDALNKTHVFYEKHGIATFVLSPFIAVVRTFAPFVAGVSNMTFGKFLTSVIVGATVWIASLVLGGYFFGNIPAIRNNLGAIVVIGLVLGLGTLAISAWLKRSKSRKA